MTRIAVVSIVASVSAFCASTWPQLVSIDDLRAPAMARGEWIEDLHTALASIAAIIETDLSLPRPQATLHFQRDRDAFRLALEADGYSPDLAEQTAATVSAVAGQVTFPDWVRLAQRFEQEAFYGYSMLAVEFLIERHGLSDVIAYFELFGSSGDRVGNFARAFGEELSAFEAAAHAQMGR